MELQRKTMKREEWPFIKEKEYKYIEEKNEEFEGTIGYIKIKEINGPLIVDSPKGKITIIDKNYTWLEFAPRNKNWWLTVMYDEKDNLIESYFDITKENIFDDISNPSFIDLKLDVSISQEKGAKILDINELEEALRENVISIEDYQKAIETATYITNSYINGSEKYYNFIEKYFNLLKEM